MRRARTVVALGAAVVSLSAAVGLGAGCGTPPNRLYGSLSEVYALDFDTVKISLIGSFLVEEYLRANGGGKTAKLSLDMTGIAVTPGQPIDLAQMAAGGGGPRGTLQRIVDTTTTQLPIMSGTLRLDQVPVAGMHLSGHFAATLSEPAGRTLDGDFDGQVVTP